MTTEPQIAVEPVTDEDVGVAMDAPGMRAILEQDRRRVAERQAPEIERLRAEVAKMHARRAVLFGELIELKHAIENGHRASAIAIIDAIARVIPDQSKTLAELRAEVARLSAACAAKDEALRLLTDMDELRETDELYIARAALSDTAGKGWIDASGAVEATCFSHCEIIGREPFGTYRDVGRVEVPKDWADDEVLIVRKPK